MKWCFLLQFLIFNVCLHAQSPLPTFPLSISTGKTTNILFPYAIRTVDRGSSVILAQKPKGSDNLLQLKASRPHFTPTNVTVVTADGRLYCFMVTYADSPAVLSFSFYSDSGAKYNRVKRVDHLPDDGFLDSQARLIETLPIDHFHAVKDQQLTLTMRHLAIDSVALWFDLVIYNRSCIPFHSGYVRFFVQDRRRSKRTAIQSVEQLPIKAPVLSPVGYHERVSLAIPFVPFSIASTQQLVIQIGEQKGGRTLCLRLSHRQLLSARHLP